MNDEDGQEKRKETSMGMTRERQNVDTRRENVPVFSWI